MSKSRQQIEALIEALDDVPIDEAEAKGLVDAHDIASHAAKLRAMVAAADARDREKVYQDARKAYAAEIERLERVRLEPKRDREELRATFRTLLKKAPPQAVAAHFHKYESVSDEELVELIRALRHLLGEDDSE